MEWNICDALLGFSDLKNFTPSSLISDLFLKLGVLQIFAELNAIKKPVWQNLEAGTLVLCSVPVIILENGGNSINICWIDVLGIISIIHYSYESVHLLLIRWGNGKPGRKVT